ncbi:hypothetical protein [Streptomyces sp. NPDC051577]|uniref:hypothetical protein n=1 Tax=Streptomyces sp. NPDC051577 TaxID=3155166 RepID=UPI0034294DDA
MQVRLMFPDPDDEVVIEMAAVPRVGEHILWQGDTDWRVDDVTWSVGTRGMDTVSLRLREGF